MNNISHIQPIVFLGTESLTIEQVVGVARYGWEVAELNETVKNEASLAAYNRVLLSKSWIDNVVKETEYAEKQKEKAKTYYGINTGFGSKAGSKALPTKKIPWVSRNLMVSHAVGVGEIFAPEIVRAAMLIRANSLAEGYSGVSIDVINTLVKMLNRGICPVVPEHGSVGASGDLAPLSHVGLVLSKKPTDSESRGENFKDYDESGEAFLRKGAEDKDLKTALIVEINGDKLEYARLSGHAAMEKCQIDLLELSAKEGLALNNGASFSAAIAALALHDAENVIRHSEIAAALSIESMLGFRDAFFPHIQTVRKQKGQALVADRILKFVENSTLMDGDIDQDPEVVPPQDAYSLRVTPQVTGAIWDTLEFTREIVSREINAATDNPLIFCFPSNHPLHLKRDYKSVSGANFHGAPIGYAMDFLKIVLTDLASLCERRIYRLIDPNLSHGLPSMIIEEEEEGLTSGIMIAQYMAAGIVSDCKVYAHPSSVDSIPTCAGQEDHVSMSTNAARHARKVVQNVEYVVAIELLCASLALEWRVQNLEGRKNQEPKDKYARVIKKLEFLGKGGSAVPGIGSDKANTVIQEYLTRVLPKLGGEPISSDRYLRPYILQATKLLQSGEIVRSVYEVCRLES